MNVLRADVIWIFLALHICWNCFFIWCGVLKFMSLMSGTLVICYHFLDYGSVKFRKTLIE